MTKKAVLWDMDGTLLDSEPLHISALAQAMQLKGMVPPDDLHILVNGMSADNVYTWLKRSFGLTEPFETWIAIKYKIYLQRVAEVTAFPEAIALWNRLRAAGVKQAIVSNSDRLLIEANLNHLSFNTAKQITVSRNDVRLGKPEPEPYLRAAWLLNIDPSDAIVLEDSPAGAQAGIAAAMTTFMVPNTPAQTPKGAQKLQSFDQIADLCGL